MPYRIGGTGLIRDHVLVIRRERPSTLGGVPKVLGFHPRGSRIVDTESDPERRLYYEILWETGGSQTDVVKLDARCIDWNRRLVIFHRSKLSADAPPAQLAIGPRLEGLLRKLPSFGALFPTWSRTLNKDRSAEFRRRCRILEINGISLHSYRYAWAERAFAAGYPERFAMANLGHSSRAVHRAYARKALVVCPPLETFVTLQAVP